MTEALRLRHRRRVWRGRHAGKHQAGVNPEARGRRHRPSRRPRRHGMRTLGTAEVGAVV